MTARVHGVVFDCPDPDALATFDQDLLGLVRVNDEEGWVVIGDSPDRPGLAFARIHKPTRACERRHATTPRADLARPRGAAVDPPRHHVDDIEATEARALDLGAKRLSGGGETFREYADPAGHPFCLVWW